MEGLHVAANGLRRVASTAEVESGTFLLRDANSYLAAPAVSTEVMIRITGLVARTAVVQRYVNPTEAPADGVYVFPFPPGAAVDRLRLQIGPRLIEGRSWSARKPRRASKKQKRTGGEPPC